MALTVVGSTASQHPDPAANTFSNLPLPSGVQAGDILIFGGTAQNTFTVTDSRLTRVADTNQELTGEGGIWVGKADGTGNAIAVTMTDSSSGSTLMTCGLVVLRGTRILATHVQENPPNPATLPVMSAPQAEVAFVASSYDTSSGEPVFASGWTEIALGADSGRYHVQAMLRQPARTATETVAFSANYVADRSVLAVFGLTDRSVLPPLRQLGRRDGLGLVPARTDLGGRSIQGTLRRYGPGTFL